MGLREMLKPCPVCGCTHLETEEIKAGYGCVKCTGCGFEFPDGADGMDMYAPDELVRRWNAIERREMSEILKPCPFCGGKAVIRDNNGLYVECYDCHMRTPPFMRKYENFAIDRWNKRPDPWHTGTPTEEGWYLVAYQHKNKMTYRAVRFFLEKNLDMEFLDSEGGIYYPDIWKAVAWQKIDPYKEANNG